MRCLAGCPNRGMRRLVGAASPKARAMAERRAGKFCSEGRPTQVRNPSQDVGRGFRDAQVSQQQGFKAEGVS